MTIDNGKMTGNYGGMAINNLGTLTVSNCTFSGNSAQAGGAINNTGTLTVLGSTFTDNTSTVYGGGAIENFGTALVCNSTLCGNTAFTNGSAIENSSGTLAVDSSTITGNAASAGNGGGIMAGSTDVALLNTIVAGNFVTGSPSTANDVSGTLGYQFDCLIGGTASSAGLMAPGNYGGPTETIGLLPTSPAHGAGNGGVLTYVASSSGIGDSLTANTFAVSFATFLAPGMVIAIDNEQMLVDSVNTSNDMLTVTRAVNGSTLAAHSDGAALDLPTDQRGITRNNDIGAFSYSGFVPSIIDSAYGINLLPSSDNGAGQTIAIIDYFGDPTVASDLHTFDQEFGLPDPPSFEQVSSNGTPTTLLTGLPNEDDESGAISQDVEWVHAIAPGANIMLVDVANTDNDWITGVDWAATHGASVVSMSGTAYGGFPGESSQDQNFNPAAYPGVTFVYDSGDYGSGNNVASATLVSAGSGYHVGDILNVLGGTNAGGSASTVAELYVSAVTASGGIQSTGFSVSAGGLYTSEPTNPVSVTDVTTPAATGATFTLTFAQEAGSDSPDVLDVGGTSLTVNANGIYAGESVWSGSGGGISSFESEPVYQEQVLVIHSGTSVVAANGWRAAPRCGLRCRPEYRLRLLRLV